MTTLFFQKACTVLLNAEERTAHGVERFFFDVGRHDDVPDDIAEKPYVQAHLGTDKDVRAAAPARNSPTTGTGGEAALTAMTTERDILVTQRDEAIERADKAEANLMDALNALSAEQAAHAETQKLLDEATAPKAAEAGEGGEVAPADAGGGQGGEAEKDTGAIAVRRGFQGSYKVMKGEEVIAEGLTKVEAEAKADELKAQG